MTKSYSAKDVRVLEEVEHIRLNPGMYIGDTETPTHLIEEALDNALDEALAGYAKIIAVVIDTKENRFAVLDDGRGIPIESDTPVTISSKLFSGAKFQDKKTAYEISSGLHGVGLVAVNALSREYNVEVYRNNKYAKYAFKNTKLKNSKITQFKGDIPFSTKIEFVPDKKFFETLTPNINRLRKRLTTASAEMPDDIQFILYVDNVKEIFRLDILKHFANECLTREENVDVVTLHSEKNPEEFSIFFTYETKGPRTSRLISSINLLPVEEGGTHVLFFYDILKEFFKIKAKKHGYDFQPNDCLYKLRAYLKLSLIEPKFSSQTKEKLTNRKTFFQKFEKDFKNQLEILFNENNEQFLSYLSKFQEYRRKLDAKKLKNTATVTKRASTKFTKLRDCTGRNGELFIVEGDSAGGSILNSRDTTRHAILPLKGKSIPNVTTKKNILDNTEVGELIMAIGTGMGPEFDMSKIRYSKIICASDADFDGAHIACLTTMVVAILLPDIIKEGKYYIAQTPLFAINEKKEFKPLWSEEDLRQARKEKRNITRFKGLGELNPDQLKISLLDKATRNLIPVSYSKNMNKLVKLFSSSSEKRKLVTK